ncbi:vacuolar protein sorting/targeting protein PEP1 [Coemansia spiralis]|uniref:Vacuolar protein sorting/targeting protein PEP1 n=2 Tax=Coemansia TaxID=4863 RepID=A0A9W8G379_9FUNG|nr:vacuolar protein sorting/targeting protein PEP1 [Coemansia umbellata]KAJ2619166.1 vacuolar protein sorting/targeting protein PEP1 [Coemansia sp. RSA 1358]KAJ2670208.1 vacuolar protein sorting/targeting protein PEP1 [Coemansia spiralis]
MALKARVRAALLWIALALFLHCHDALAKNLGNAPKITHTFFKESLSKLLYFKNPSMLLGIDKAGGKIYQSSDSGIRWDHVGAIPDGKASRLYGHPFEPKVAYVLSDGNEHWMTHDEGKSWQAFSTPIPPTTSGERPLSFHADRTGWILFIGEKCTEERGGWWPLPRLVCYDEPYYTRDGFLQAAADYKSGDRTGSALNILLGEKKPVVKCMWARHTKEFEATSEETIFCLEIASQGDSDSKKRDVLRLDGVYANSSASSLFSNPHKRTAQLGDGATLAGTDRHKRYLTNKRSIASGISGIFDSLGSANVVRLVVSEDFFSTKRVVHFGSGNDGTGGDRAGGGVLAISVVKNYILVAISHANSEEMDLFISMDGHTWAESHLPLPPGTEEDAYTILESSKHAIFVDVLSPTNVAASTLFRSNSNGTYYTQSLEHAHRAENGVVDFERIHGVEGVVIANQVSNWEQVGRGSIFHRDKLELRSRISFNDGARWRFLQPPDKDANGKSYGCSKDGKDTGDCALHLHSVTSTRSRGRIFGAPSASGIVMAVGNVGPKLLKWRECDTFLSRDGGLSWKNVHSGAHHVQLVDSASVLVLVSDEEPTDVVRYSLDSGDTWQSASLEYKVRVSALFVDDDGLSPVLVAVGTVHDGSHAHEQILSTIDFSNVWSRQCKVDPNDPKANSDMEGFVLTAHEGNDCIMGHRSEHIRRKPDAQCALRLDRVLVPRQEDCKCTAHDFECDYNYALNSKGECELVGDEVIPKGQCLKKGDHFMASSGYRMIPGNTCLRDMGETLDKSVDKLCPRVQSPNGDSHDHNNNDGGGDGDGSKSTGSVSHHTMVVSGEVHIMAFPNTTSYLLMTSAQDLYRTDDEGNKWVKVDIASSTGNPKIGRPVYIAEHQYDNQRAFVYTENDILAFTKDRGVSWQIVKNLPSPANSLHIRPIIDFNPENPDWLLFIGGTSCPECHSEVWVSRDNGIKWNRITTHATKCYFGRSKEFNSLPPETVVCTNYRFTSGKENEQDVQRSKKNPQNYVELRVFTNPFIDSNYHLIPLPDPEHSELLTFHIYSRFIVAAVMETAPDDTGRSEKVLQLYVSDDGKTAHAARFPPGVNIKAEGFTLLPSHGGTILIDVEGAPNTGDPDWGTGWGTLFASNSNGTHFHMVLEHTNRNRIGMVDIERVDGLNGMLIANRVLNAKALGRPGTHKELRTVASWDDGRSWRPLEPPRKDSAGKDIDCLDCTLNFYSKSSLIGMGALYGVSSAPGYLIAVGSVGAHLGRYTEARTYLSRDGGISWSEIRGAQSQYEFGDHGGLLFTVDDVGTTDTLRYSYDSGGTWSEYKFTNGGSRVIVDQIINGLDSGGQNVIILGREFSSGSSTNKDETTIITVDFTKLHSRQCTLDARDHAKSDFELWTPRWNMDRGGNAAPICSLGTETSYWRRKPSANCYVGHEFDPPETRTRVCECSIQDFECEEGFWLNDYGECVLDGPDPYQPADCREGTTYKGQSGYRKINLSQCTGGDNLEKPVDRICGRSGGLHVSAQEFNSPIADIMYFGSSHHIVLRTEDDQIHVSLDEGGKWAKLALPDTQTTEKDIPEIFSAIIQQPYFDEYAYFMPIKGTVALYTEDGAITTRLLHLPTAPSPFYQPALRFHPEYPDWLIFLGQPNENCRSVDSSSCKVEAFISRDHGAHWDALYTPLGAGGCSFVRTDRLTKVHPHAVVCARHLGARGREGDIVVSENFFKKESVLVKNATDFVIMGEFLLVSQDADNGNALTMHISLNGRTAAVAKFPGNKSTMDPAYTVLEPPEGFEYRDANGHNQEMPGGGVMMHVTKNSHPGAEWGTLYSSNSNGTYYRQTLEFVNRDENGLVDFERIRALEGVSIANIVSNPDSVLKTNKPKKLQTMITIDGGSRWHFLRVDGSTPCHQTAPQKGDCALHLHGYTEVSDPENIYSASGAVGLVMGVGSVGSQLERIGASDTYLSSDGGTTWKLVRSGPKWHEFGDHGSLIVVADRIHPISEIEYSLDRGKTWLTLALPREAQSMRVEALTTTPDSTSRHFIIYGKKNNSNKGIVVGLDFTGVQPRICKFDPLTEKEHSASHDFELFAPKPIDPKGGESECILGRKVQYYRRIADRECYVGNEFQHVRYISETCECTERDYECNHNFVREDDDENPFGKCVLIKGMQAPRTDCTKGQKDYFIIESAYRKLPQSICRKGLVLDRPTEVWCPGKARLIAILWALILPIIFLTLAYFGYKAWRNRYPYFRLEDIGPAVRPAIRNFDLPRPNSGVLKQIEPIFFNSVATAKAVASATKEGLLWGLDRAAPYLPRPVQRWSYEHPPRWGALLRTDGGPRQEIRRGQGSSRFTYHPLRTSEPDSRVSGTFEDSHDLDIEDPAFDEYDAVESGFNHFLEEENFDSAIQAGENDARPVDRQVLFANTELSDNDDDDEQEPLR